MLAVVVVLILLALLKSLTGNISARHDLGSALLILTTPEFVAAALVAMTPLLLAALGGLINCSAPRGGWLCAPWGNIRAPPTPSASTSTACAIFL
jgi:hypothetical protein